MLYALIFAFSFGYNGGTLNVVPGFKSKESCDIAGKTFTREIAQFKGTSTFMAAGGLTRELVEKRTVFRCSPYSE